MLTQIDSHYSAEIGPTSIQLYRSNVRGAFFKVGDRAEYDSYNLSYLGEITRITPKTVTIVAYKNSSQPRTHRLKLAQFAWRNWNFDLEKTLEENTATSYYI